MALSQPKVLVELLHPLSINGSVTGMSLKQKSKRLIGNLRVGLLLISLATCSGLDNFQITESSESTVSGATIFERLIGDLGFGDWLNLDLTQNEKLANQGVEGHQLDTVYLHSLTLTITEGHRDQDFSFIESIDFFANGPGLEKKLIARGSSFATGIKSVGLEIESVNLAPYASANSMTITTDVDGHRPDHQTTIRAEIVLDIDVNVAGVLCGPET